MNIAIVDDEPLFIESLAEKICNICQKEKIAANIDNYTNGYDFIEKCKKYHLVFLDIEMPNINGIEVANQINQLKGYDDFPLFAFLTSHEKMVFEALNSYPYTFIRKSDFVTGRAVENCIKKVISILNNKSQTILVRTNRDDILIKLSDIIYIEKKINYSYIHTAKQVYPVKNTLSELICRLDSEMFFRCHEGFIVNIDYICKIKDNCITLNNDESILVSRSKFKATKSAFMKRVVKTI